jgi:hypothetical protein
MVVCNAAAVSCIYGTNTSGTITTLETQSGTGTKTNLSIDISSYIKIEFYVTIGGYFGASGFYDVYFKC